MNDIFRMTTDYIEENLKTEISLDELSYMSRYSVYHFCRIFSKTYDMPVAEYILKRRLKHAIYEISSGRKAIDVVMEYGFETYAGFYKAFVKEFGCSPRKYISVYGKSIGRPELREVTKMNITRTEIRELLKNWNIGQNDIHDVPIMNGEKIADDKWFIGEDYVLRVYSNRNKLMKNAAAAKAISNEGFEASLPVKTRAGKDFLDGEILAVLTKRVTGQEICSDEVIGDRRLEYAAEYGRAIAKLHLALLSIEDELICDNADIYKTVTGWALPNVKMQNEQWAIGLPPDFFEDYTISFGELQGDLKRQLIHRDPNPGNILFNNAKVSGIIDFVLCERNIRLFDPCYCATGILCGMPEEQRQVWLEIVECILRAYDAANPLTDAEKKSVFYTLCSIQMICVAYFDSVDDPDYKKLAQVNRKMLAFIVKNKERLQRIF